VRVFSSLGVPLSRTPIPRAAAVATAIEQLPEVASVARLRLNRATTARPDGSELDIVLVGTTHSGARVAWTLLKGADLPIGSGSGESCPVLVGSNLATVLNLEPGAVLPLRVADSKQASALPIVSCTVVGVARSLFSAAGEYDVLTPMESLERLNGGADPDTADLVLVASRPEAGPAAAVKAIAQLHPDLRVYSNDDVLAQFNQNGFTYFRQISLVLSSITVVFTFLLVGTILTVSTNQRLGEIAALRALGIGRPRIAAMLMWESALIVGGGGLVALPLGAVVASGLDRILRQMPGVPETLHFFVFEINAVVLHVALLAAAAVIAAGYPIWLTARLPIASTLRREVVG
jgi:ABC-type lipoprotein release transport system permease subunit